MKLTWVKRLCSGIDAPWKHIPTYFLANVGGTELFNCNYDTKLLNLNKHIPSFYKQVICYWQEIKLSTPENKEAVLQEIIWNNRFIKVNGKSVFYSKWRQNGIKQIKDLFDVPENCFLPFEVLANKFHIKRRHFLHYHSLVSAIPSEWKKLLFKNESSPTPASSSCILSKPLSCKILYQELLTRQKLPCSTAEKRFEYYNFQRDDFSKIYLLPFKATKETKLIMFQYKIIHHILFTNSLLYKLKKVSSPHCPFCPAIHQTVTHLFVECEQASIFWSEFQNWILQLCNLQLVLSAQDVIYGIIRQLNPPCLALNQLIILGKYFLYVNALNTEKSTVIDFKRLVQDEIELEKYIAVTSGQQKLFFAKWQNFAHLC